MTMRLTWIAAGGAACFYDVAQLVAGRRPVQLDSLTSVEPAARELARFLAASGIEADRFFAHLVPQAIEIESMYELASRSLTRVVGHGRAETEARPVAGLLTNCQRAYFAAFPRLVDELSLRTGPLRELWEGAGPGLLAGVARRTDRRVLVDDATITVVQPFRGGGGSSHAPYNKVAIEAVLANPVPQLPETVRLGGLLATLAADLPDLTEHLPPVVAAATGMRLTPDLVVQLSILPALLEAAADVELVRPSDDLLAVAAKAWDLPQAAGPKTADVVHAWWKTVRAAKASWPAALVALQRMLAE